MWRSQLQTMHLSIGRTAGAGVSAFTASDLARRADQEAEGTNDAPPMRWADGSSSGTHRLLIPSTH